MPTCPLIMECILHKLLKPQDVLVETHDTLLKFVQEKVRSYKIYCFFHENIEDQILMGSIRSLYLPFNFSLLPKIDSFKYTFARH